MTANARRCLGCRLSLIIALVPTNGSFGPTAQQVVARAQGFRQVTDDPAFEVAAIRRVRDPFGGTYRVSFTPEGRLVATNIRLSDLVVRAFGISFMRLVGLPGWATTEYFDIEARADAEAVAAKVKLAPLLRTLLRARFQLRAHSEARELPSFVLVPARADGTLGRGLSRAKADCSAYRSALERAANELVPRPSPTDPACMTETKFNGENVTLVFRSAPISGLAVLLTDWTRTPVFDETGLHGEFDITLTLRRDSIPLYSPNRVPTPEGSASMFGDVREQLGLKLESRTRSVEVLVIDKAEMPTPN